MIRPRSKSPTTSFSDLSALSLAASELNRPPSKPRTKRSATFPSSRTLIADLKCQLSLFHRSRDDADEKLVGDWLLEKIIRPGAHCFYSNGNVTVTRDDDYGQAPIDDHRTLE